MLVPTRELALQTSSIVKELAKHMPAVQVMVSTGGTNLRDDILRMESTTHIVVSLLSLYFVFLCVAVVRWKQWDWRLRRAACVPTGKQAGDFTALITLFLCDLLLRALCLL